MGDKIPVITSEGGGYLSKEEAAQAFREGTARAPRSAEEMAAIRGQEQQAIEAEKYGGAANAAKAFAVKAVDVTGLARPLATAWTRASDGDEAAQALNENLDKLEQYHGLASGAGTVASFLAPSVAAKGFGALAKGEGALAKGAGFFGKSAEAAALPVRGLSAVGQGIERGAVGLLGEGALSKIGGRALGMGAETALMGAQQELSRELTEEALGNHALNAERIFSAGAHDFVYGALLGGALGVGSVVGKKALGGVSGLLKGKGAAEALDDWSGEQIVKAGGPKQSQITKMDRWGMGHENVGKVVRDEAESLIGRKIGNRADLEEAVTKGIAREGEKLTATVGKMDEALEKAGQRAKLYDSLLEAEGKALEGYKGVGALGESSRIQNIKNFFTDARREFGLVDGAGELIPGAESKSTSLGELWKMRQKADELWTKSGTAATLKDDAFKAIRDALEDGFIKKADLASDLSGGSLKAEYQAAKRQYGAFAGMRDVVERGNAAIASNQFLSLTDKINQGFGATIGTALGGGPLGMLAGTAIGGLGSKFVRGRFPYVAANIADRASKILQTAETSRAMKLAADDAVASLFEPTKVAAAKAIPSAVSMFGKTAEERAAKVEKTVTALQDVAAQAERIGSRTSALSTEAPKTAAALSQQAALVTGYLTSKAPKPILSSLSLTPWLDKPKYSDHEVAQFANALGVASDPIGVIHKAARGLVSRDDVDALKQMYPEVYQDARMTFMSMLFGTENKGNKAQRGHKLPLDKRLAIVTLFDIPTPLTEPGFVGAIQQSIVEQGESSQPSGQATQTGRTAGDAKAAAQLSDAMRTDTERLNHGDFSGEAP